VDRVYIFIYKGYELYKHFFGLWNVAKRTAFEDTK